MQVNVKLFAAARQRAGRATIPIEMAEPATVGELKRLLALACPELSPLIASMMIAVAADYAKDETRISAGDEVAVIPPVSGGAVPFLDEGDSVKGHR